jgi:nitrogen fixation protein NifU and related proteins
VTDIGALYRDVILDHYRHPRNFRALEHARKAEGHNPLCGDRFTVFVRLECDIVEEVSFQGSGCAIATASASLMTERLHRCTLAAADRIRIRFEQMISNRADAPVEDLGDLSALSGVRQFPLRHQCAMMAWRAFAAAVASPF